MKEQCSLSREISIFLGRTGISMRKLADMAGTSPATVCRLVSGERRDTASTTAEAIRRAMREVYCTGNKYESENIPTGMCATRR